MTGIGDLLSNGALSLSVAVLVGILLLLEVGRRVGRHRLARYGDTAATGTGAIEGAVFGLLGLLIAIILACAFLAGHAMSSNAAPPWPHIFGFALVMALAFYVILDIECPRVGFIRISDAHQYHRVRPSLEHRSSDL